MDWQAWGQFGLIYFMGVVTGMMLAASVTLAQERRAINRRLAALARFESELAAIERNMETMAAAHQAKQETSA
jgi:hypothetical protein